MKIPGFHSTYIALLVAAATVMVIEFFTGNVIDIHLHDTMFVISAVNIAGLFFLLIVILYLANRWLTGKSGKANLFLWLVLIATWLMWVLIAYLNIEDPTPAREYLDMSSLHSWSVYRRWVERIVTVVVIIFLFSQLAFWLYFTARIVYRLLKKKSTAPV